MKDQPLSAERENLAFPPNAVHVLRTAQQAHLTLSQMADQKANMLLAATFVVFTIALGQARDTAHELPLLILGAGAFCSAVLAIFAVMPTGHRRRSAPVNLLFFGSFQDMSEEDYVARTLAAVQSDECYLAIMARDIYQSGRVLARKKYRLLGYAYRVFLLGISGSFIAFLFDYIGPMVAR